MARLYSPDAFYASARAFALSALEAHHEAIHRRVALDAGTALEHLAKACLSKRSPALLAELKSESSTHSVIRLLGIEGADSPAGIRTIGPAEALRRIGLFVKSKADRTDLQTLTDMRNGVVHAGEDVEVEERILAAFAQHADSLVEDLGRDREDFWAGQLAVVDALLNDASDKIAHRVEVKRASATASFESRCTNEGQTVMEMVRALSKSAVLTMDQRLHACPVCNSFGIAIGGHSVDWQVTDVDKETGDVTHVEPLVLFSARAFHCQVCGLRLDSPAEIDKCFEPAWEIEDADWHDYEPEYEADDY